MVKTTFARERPTQGLLFNGLGWLTHAQNWALAAGLKWEGWSVDQTFRAGGRRFAARWNDDTGRWETVELDQLAEKEVERLTRP